MVESIVFDDVFVLGRTRGPLHLLQFRTDLDMRRWRRMEWRLTVDKVVTFSLLTEGRETEDDSQLSIRFVVQ